MKKINLILISCTLLFSSILNASIFPEKNEWKIGLGKTSFNSYQALKSEAESELSPTISYGFNNKLFISLNYLTYEDSFDDPNETVKTSLGVHYAIFENEKFKFLSNFGLSSIDTEFNDQDENGVSFYFEAESYFRANDFFTPYIGLKYFTDPSSDMDYKDNLLETIGIIFSPAKSWDLSIDYEFSNQAFSYGTSFYFNF